jgi:hypothetical protein
MESIPHQIEGKIVSLSQKGLSFPTYTKRFAEGLFPAMIIEIK